MSYRFETCGELSKSIAVAVATVAYEEGLATAPRPDDIESAARARMYDGTYPCYA